MISVIISRKQTPSDSEFVFQFNVSHPSAKILNQFENVQGENDFLESLQQDVF